MKRKPKIIVWNVTSKCNLACEYCFRPTRIKEPSTQKALDKIEQFRKQGGTSLVFTGGEPLLRQDIVKLIEFAKEQGLYTILHTNGLLLREDLFDKMERNLDQINLPLDGYNEETNRIFRGKGHFRQVMQSLSWLKNKDIRVIISTCLTSINKDYITKIARVIPQFIYKWRIFQFSPQGKAKEFIDKFYLSDKEFAIIREKIEKMDLPFKMQVIGIKDRKFHESYYVV